jgi:drug/metabolite transporter (DMT)-like permease
MSEVVKKEGWLAPSGMCVLLYGMWGFLSKLAQVKGLPAAQESLVQKLGVFLSLPVVQMLAARSAPAAIPGAVVPAEVSIMSRPKGAILASFLSGASSCFASLFYSAAMSNGDASTVSAVTACYPPVTMILGKLFLGEEVSKDKLVGM